VRAVLPPLRERRDDIAMLVADFFRELSGDPGAAPPVELVRTMMRGTWKGNVRELRSAVERALVGAPALEAQPEPSTELEMTFRAAKQRATSNWEKQYLSELLPAHDGNVSRAARAARMDRGHLSELARRYGLTAGDDESGA
jgi:DNA-binding NtrC family response regulator